MDQVREREIATLMAGQADDMASGYTADVAFMPPNSPLLTGREAVMSWAVTTAAAYEISVEYTGSEVTVAGDWAIERYSGAFTFTPKAGGEPITDTMKGIHVYQRQPDDSWLIAQDIWNENNAPVGP
ncbi:MAG: YybH family protein [Planctomycetota bacterium]